MSCFIISRWLFIVSVIQFTRSQLLESVLLGGTIADALGSLQNVPQAGIDPLQVLSGASLLGNLNTAGEDSSVLSKAIENVRPVRNVVTSNTPLNKNTYGNANTVVGINNKYLESSVPYYVPGRLGINGLYNSVPNSVNSKANSNLANSNLANSNVANSILANSNFAYVNVANSNLAKSNLAHGNVANSNLANINLVNSDLANSNYANSNLANSNLANSNLANSNLANSNLANSNLANSNLANRNLAYGNVANSNLANSYLTSSNLASINSANINFASSNLANGNLANSYLANSNLATGNRADINANLATILANIDKSNQKVVSADTKLVSSKQEKPKFNPLNQNVVHFPLTMSSGYSDVPIGIQVAANNLEIGGSVAVNGQLPFQGAVSVDGSVTTEGRAIVQFGDNKNGCVS